MTGYSGLNSSPATPKFKPASCFVSNGGIYRCERAVEEHIPISTECKMMPNSRIKKAPMCWWKATSVLSLSLSIAAGSSARLDSELCESASSRLSEDAF